MPLLAGTIVFKLLVPRLDVFVRFWRNALHRTGRGQNRPLWCLPACVVCAISISSTHARPHHGTARMISVLLESAAARLVPALLTSYAVGSLTLALIFHQLVVRCQCLEDFAWVTASASMITFLSRSSRTCFHFPLLIAYLILPCMRPPSRARPARAFVANSPPCSATAGIS